jgi:hypothetical protein
MRTLFLVLFLSSFVFISACASVGNSRIENKKYVKSGLNKSDMNKETAKRYFGRTSAEFNKNGRDVLEYRVTRIKQNFWSFVPLISLTVPKDKRETYSMQYLYLFFSKDDKLIDHKELFLKGSYGR